MGYRIGGMAEDERRRFMNAGGGAGGPVAGGRSARRPGGITRKPMTDQEKYRAQVWGREDRNKALDRSNDRTIQTMENEGSLQRQALVNRGGYEKQRLANTGAYNVKRSEIGGRIQERGMVEEGLNRRQKGRLESDAILQGNRFGHLSQMQRDRQAYEHYDKTGNASRAAAMQNNYAYGDIGDFDAQAIRAEEAWTTQRKIDPVTGEETLVYSNPVSGDQYTADERAASNQAIRAADSRNPDTLLDETDQARIEAAQKAVGSQALVRNAGTGEYSNQAVSRSDINAINAEARRAAKEKRRLEREERVPYQYRTARQFGY